MLSSILTTFILFFFSSFATAGLLDFRSQYSQYKCMTLQKWETQNVACARNCENFAMPGKTGCKTTDFYCLCQRTQDIDDYMVPCMLTPGGVNATCSNEELGWFQGNVTNVCKYFNATGYAAYATCPMLVF